MSSDKKPELEKESKSAYVKDDEDGAASKSRDNFDFIITETKRRKVKKFNASEISFDVKVSVTSEITVIDIEEGLHRLFEAVLEKVSGDLGPNDMIKFSIRSESVDNPISLSTGLMPLHQLTSETIISKIEEMVPSGKEIPLDEPLSIDVTTIKRT